MLKKIFFHIIILWLGGCHFHAQTVLNTSVLVSQNSSDPYSIRMLPGFEASSIANPTLVFRAYIASNLTTGNSYSPITVSYTSTLPATENYIYARTYLVPTATENAAAQQIQNIQFYDGLGKPKQNITIKSTPKGNDLVTIIPYDNFGRQVDSYLPISMTSNSGGIQNLDESGVVTYYTTSKNTTTKDFDLTDTNPFSHQNLENSPLDRIIDHTAEGVDWQGKKVTFAYDLNISNEVKKYTTSNSWLNGSTNTSLVDSGFYSSATLYKNSATDEDGNVSIEYKNGQGQTVLVRKILSSTENADTYYVYNEFDALSYVIPPLADGNSPDTNSSVLDDLCYQYRYDSQNRLVEKKLPGKGWEYMVYDKQDRVAMTQDANLGKDKKWLFTKYDKFNRIAYTGIYTSSNAYSSTARNTEQSNINNLATTYVNRNDSGSSVFSGLVLPYDNLSSSSYPTNITELLSVNYYDTYPSSPTPVLPTSILGANILRATTSNGLSTKSLPLASFVKNTEVTDNSWAKNYTYYDTKTRIVATHSYNSLGGFTKTESKLLFSGKPDYTINIHSRASTTIEQTVTDSLVYDHQERLVRHFSQINGGAKELLSENIYNELGQLQTKNVGNLPGATLQSIDYKYNIRGWLNKINNPDNLGTKLFAYQIDYNTLNPKYPTGTKKYNGNIAQVSWATQSDSVLRIYSYQYDRLNRLTSSEFWDAMNQNIGQYQENLTYDINGNIKTLYRTGQKRTGYTAPELMDKLVYNYDNTNKSNRLIRIDESANGGNALSGYPLASGKTGQTIQYDAGTTIMNGNMTSMPDKGISSITYNYLNLPLQVNSSQGTTTNTYRADGVKISKTFGTKSTTYLDGFQYENNVLQFMPTSEGYYDFIKNAYIYNYTDHLGNVRVGYTKNSAGASEIIEENNYYAFGLKQEGYNQTLPYSKYNYKYNGKELQETGMYAMDFRPYMADIGRFVVQDALGMMTPDWTPYRFAFNNPLYFSDPTGLSEIIGNALSKCTTCPNTPDYKRFIDDPKNIFVFDPKTKTVELEGQIEGVEIIPENKKRKGILDYISFFNDRMGDIGALIEETPHQGGSVAIWTTPIRNRAFDGINYSKFNLKYYSKNWTGNGFTGPTTSISKFLTKGSIVASVTLGTIEIGIAAKKDYKDYQKKGETHAKNSVVTAAKVTSSLMAGMYAGALIGTTIPIPIVGTVAGAVGGAIVGYIIGEKVGNDVEEIYNNFEK